MKKQGENRFRQATRDQFHYYIALGFWTQFLNVC